MKTCKILLLFFSIVLFQNIFADDESNFYQIIIRLKNMPEIASLSAINPHINDLEQTIGLKIDNFHTMSGGNYVLVFNPNQIQELAKQKNEDNDTVFQEIIKLLAARTDVEFAVQNHLIRLDPIEIQFTKQPLTAIQWTHADQWDEKVPDDSTPANPSWGVNLEKAWTLEKTKGDGIVVAVIDTGIASNTDLKNVISPCANFYAASPSTDCSDDGDGTSYHGTHVAGTIAANGTIFGMAPNAKILPVKSLGKEASSDEKIINGMNWAAGIHVDGIEDNQNPAKILNLSLGGYADCSAAYQTAIDNIRAKGITIVVAAGNENMDAKDSSPGNCQNVITVAATNCRGIRAPYSNYGSTVTIAAPGGTTFIDDDWSGILSTIKNGYIHMQGTSMATPHVAGIAALLYAIKPTATPDNIKTWLTAKPHSFLNPCSPTDTKCKVFDCSAPRTCGAGLVDAYTAVQAAQAAQ